jgi:hypothetical protein
MLRADIDRDPLCWITGIGLHSLQSGWGFFKQAVKLVDWQTTLL